MLDVPKLVADEDSSQMADIPREPPACCKKSMEELHRVMDSAGALKVALAAAPSLAVPPVSVSKLWTPLVVLGKVVGGRLRMSDAKIMVAPIVSNRVRLICDREIVRHNNDPGLREYWENIRRRF